MSCVDAILEFLEIDDIAEKLRAHILSRYGEHRPNIVIVHGNTRESLRLFGDLHAMNRVRTALFNVAATFSPLKLDVTARSWEARRFILLAAWQRISDRRQFQSRFVARSAPCRMALNFSHTTVGWTSVL
jgi:hypothetical protein